MNFFFQHDQMDCGPACVCMIASHYGKTIDIQTIRDKSHITKEGVSLLNISEASKDLGFKTVFGKLKISDLNNSILPCILHWNKNHFVVLKRVQKNILTGNYRFIIADPGHGIINLSKDDFKKSWLSDDVGIALFLDPSKEFYENKIEKNKFQSFKHLISYLSPHKKQLFILFFLLLLGSSITLVLPILTQKLIDDGVTKKNLNVISYILLAQLAFFLGNITFGVIRNWLTLNIGTQINIRIVVFPKNRNEYKYSF